jgi:hypothetical protein
VFREQILHNYSAVDNIVGVFAAIAKSNSVLVSRSMSFNDCSDLEGIIYRARKGLQDLLKSAAMSCSGTSASCVQSITNS